MKKSKRSGFQPPRNREAAMEAYIEQVNQEILDLLKSNAEKNNPNISSSERKCLEDLKSNKDIIIKPADKGGAIIVMNRTAYEEEIKNMLNDEKFYEEQDKDLNGDFAKELKDFVEGMEEKKLIDVKEKKFLIQNEHVSPIIYGLPKIHKFFESMPSFRPIVSGCGSCMEGVSKFVDFHLKPLTFKAKSFVRDTTDFLRKIKDLKVGPDDIIVAADVCSLYTVINHEEGAKACAAALNGRTNDEKKKMPTGIIKKLILMILKSNCFSFLGKFFLQVCGTAMGTPMAPSYANLFMTEVETKIIQSFKLRTGLEPLAWFRFLDDIIFVWSHGEESLKNFFEHMQSFGEVNKMKTSLKFTFEYGKSVPFLDTTVTLKDGKIVTDLFCKSTDAHLYLRNDSCHPKNCMKGLAKGEFLRVHRICSSEEVWGPGS
jgi:hypothetical protein